MSNIIEQLIDDIIEYLDNCKYQPLSNTKIVVNKEEIDELLRELRSKTPQELAKYQKVVSNREAIIKDAKVRAQALIDDAAQRTSEMLSQNAIMKQAYAQADEVVKSAYVQAQEILTNATYEANTVRSAAVEYMDNMLAGYEQIVADTMRITQSTYENFYSQLAQYYETVVSNRNDLNPPSVPEETAEMNLEYMDLDEEQGEEFPTDNEDIPAQAPMPAAASTGGIQVPPGPNTNGDDLKLDLLS
ncbi:MAG: vacuolar family H+-ATPase subunit H [Lachnospiraceae bacterium]|nr:vacuolar family H+-ATPase subunit H [Lachnospiraceae bacterium]